MDIWPAIDLRGGTCVRLQQGDFSRETVYADDVVQVAEHWKAQGASRLHLVDLDGARSGTAGNRRLIGEVISGTALTCQVGGGIRSDADIDQLLALGASRIVIGTLAVESPDWFASAATRHPYQLVLGIDARDGQVAVSGWSASSGITVEELVGRFAGLPLAGIVFTDIARDGMLAGPNLDAMAEMVEIAPWPVIASGGVTRLSDVADLEKTGVDGCIIGRALYEGTIKLPQVLSETQT